MDVWKVEFEFHNNSKTSIIIKAQKKEIIYDESDQYVLLLDEVHKNEIKFYEMIKREGNTLNLKVPEYFYSETMGKNKLGFLVLEDLSEKYSIDNDRPFYGYYLMSDKSVGYFDDYITVYHRLIRVRAFITVILFSN